MPVVFLSGNVYILSIQHVMPQIYKTKSGKNPFKAIAVIAVAIGNFIAGITVTISVLLLKSLQHSV